MVDGGEVTELVHFTFLEEVFRNGVQLSPWASEARFKWSDKGLGPLTALGRCVLLQSGRNLNNAWKLQSQSLEKLIMLSRVTAWPSDPGDVKLHLSVLPSSPCGKRKWLHPSPLPWGGTAPAPAELVILIYELYFVFIYFVLTVTELVMPYGLNVSTLFTGSSLNALIECHSSVC